MRLDKFIQISRIIKRRSLAKLVCDSGKVLVNGQKAKPSKELKAGDILTIDMGKEVIKCQVLSIPISSNVKKEGASSLYKLLNSTPQGRRGAMAQ